MLGLPINPACPPVPAATPTAQAIEDAILFGGLAKLDALLTDMQGLDDQGAAELRYGLEALRHFRSWYGADGVLRPTTHRQRQKIAVLEAAWGAELLEMVRRRALPELQRTA